MSKFFLSLGSNLTLSSLFTAKKHLKKTSPSVSFQIFLPQPTFSDLKSGLLLLWMIVKICVVNQMQNHYERHLQSQVGVQHLLTLWLHNTGREGCQTESVRVEHQQDEEFELREVKKPTRMEMRVRNWVLSSLCY